jgi:CBS domain-containing protein
VYDYRAGKQDWMGAGLPTEGTGTERPRLADVVRRDVPTCSLGERLGDVRNRVTAAGWDACVVVSQDRVVLGLLRARELRADPGLPVERAMRPGPSTYRPFVSVAEMRRTMIDRGLESSPVTTSDGKLVGLVRRTDLGSQQASGLGALVLLDRPRVPVGIIEEAEA